MSFLRGICFDFLIYFVAVGFVDALSKRVIQKVCHSGFYHHTNCTT